jgi:dGTPase
MYDSDMNKRAAENLIYAGAFDCFGGRRSQLASVSEKLIDAIAASQDGEGVRLSSTRKKALADLRAFMFQAVYCNPVAKGEESKAQAMLELLFRHYIDHLDELPGDYYAIAQAEGPERAVCDYLAGMTDSYAVDRYGDVFIPKAWTVK